MHTPGPWTAAKRLHYAWTFIAGGEVIGELTDTRQAGSNKSPELDANARLIAAAPELLDACRAFVEAYAKSLQLEKTDGALRLAKAALAKAEGDA